MNGNIREICCYWRLSGASVVEGFLFESCFGRMFLSEASQLWSRSRRYMETTKDGPSDGEACGRHLASRKEMRAVDR
jgi:hypothetical protein